MRTKFQSGQKYFYLTLKEKCITQNQSKILWKAICDCGNETTISPADAKRGKVKSCGCFMKHHSGRKPLFHPRIASARMVWRTYKDGCDFENFLKLSQETCFYCGALPFRKFNLCTGNKDYNNENQIKNGDFIYNGLDRIDNTRDHTPDNVVPCCTHCNKAKLDLSIKDFLIKIEKIYHHTTNIRKEIL